MSWVLHRPVTGFRWLAVLAGLALLVQMLVPQGFMLTANAEGASTFYICNGHGPIDGIDKSKSDKAPKSGGNTVCAYASHAAAATPPIVPPLSAAPFFAAAPSSSQVVVVRPGLGLAAPPPPSHAPPLA